MSWICSFLLLSNAAAQEQLAIGLDVNGDGVILTALDTPAQALDQSSAEKPFVFWVNDDQDDLKDFESWPIVRSDADTAVIDSVRDLEDFALLRLDVSSQLQATQLRLRLHAADTAGAAAESPTLNLYRVASARCDQGYLLDSEQALAQVTAPAHQRTARLTVAAAVEIPLAWLSAGVDSRSSVCLLFDAAAAGRATLGFQITLADGTVSSAESAWLDIRPVKTLYRRVRVLWPEDVKPPWTYVDAQPPVPDLQWQWDEQGGAYLPPAKTDDRWHSRNTIVWVYGWQRTGEHNYQQATLQVGATVFKRLWHRGYRDELIFFHWATVKPRLAYGLLRSEYRALKTGKVLQEFVSTLPPERRIHLTAHSLGNVVLTEALRLGLTAEQALLQQAAVPAGAFDSRPLLRLSDASFSADLPSISYEGYLTDIATPLYSLFNVFDYTFVGWNIAQKVFKPSSIGSYSYYYDPGAEPSKRYQLRRRRKDFMQVRYVKDPHEILAFVVPSVTQPLGAEPRTRGMIAGSVSLAGEPFNFGSGHVAGWRFDPQQTTAYYNQLLDFLNLPYRSIKR